MTLRYIYDIQEQRLPGSIGNKAVNLRRLMDKGIKIPKTFICTWKAFDQYQVDPQQTLQNLQNEIEQKIPLDIPYAIRSSANIEDGSGQSFAGQFTSHLGVEGLLKILESVQSVWLESESPRVKHYLERLPQNNHNLKMGVIIQEMVQPLVSGVVFSKNPLTGFDEMVVEAVNGMGEALVQAGVTPTRWIYKWGRWMEGADHEEIDIKIIQQVVDGARKIADTFGGDVDLEWAFDGKELYWLQMRQITTLEAVPIYSNKISKEFLPGMIKPLIWSLNTSIINGAWIDLLTEVIGENDLDPARMAKAIYYRAYFEMSTFGKIFDRLGLPRETLEIQMGILAKTDTTPSFRPSIKTLVLLPRLIWFLLDKLRFSRKLRHTLPDLETDFQSLAGLEIQGFTEIDLIQTIDRLYAITYKAAYLNIVAPLLMFVYNGILRSQLKNQGFDLEDVQVIEKPSYLERYDPVPNLNRLHEIYTNLDANQRKTIAESTYTELQRVAGIRGFIEQVAKFIDQFGHLSDSGNDFSLAPWRENPDIILGLITAYDATPQGMREKVKITDLPIAGVKRLWLRIVHRRAGEYRIHREHISSVYTFGYGLFRRFYLALADHFVHRGVIKDREDIFYLFDQEIRGAVTDPSVMKDYPERVRKRKDEINKYRDIDLPSIVYGDSTPPVYPIDRQVLKGTPTSKGYYTGRVKVVQGIQDFSKVNRGDVLAIPYSDVGWTPLFAKAGAVIAESGGMLSHSSIVAREFNIPAVVSVDGACRLADDSIVTVDGFRGEISLLGPSNGQD